MTRRIAVVTGSRADYGLLRWPMQAIADSPDLALTAVATGMHLAPEFGLTVDEITRDGFAVAERVEMLLAGDGPVALTKAIGLGTIGFADLWARLSPDLILLLGDRFEIYAAAQAALAARIPIAHLCGGDVTEGAIDDALRHGITKLAHLHFVTTAEAARRVRQLGEDPDHIHWVGSPGLDALRHISLPDRKALAAEVQFDMDRPVLLLTFHPVTLGTTASDDQVAELLAALDQLDPGIGLLFTAPNADREGRAVRAAIERFVAAQPHRAGLVANLGHRRYLAMVKEAAAVVGNSSSGLYEAPSFDTPTLDIGERQRGRLRASSVLHCAPERGAILAGLRQVMSQRPNGTVNPYGDGFASERIVSVLRRIQDFRSLVVKRFHDIAFPFEPVLVPR